MTSTSQRNDRHNGGDSSIIYKGVELSCVVGNILDSQCDAVCVSCDSHYSLATGVGRAVMKAGGSAFLSNLTSAKAAAGGRGGPLAVAAAGGLTCRHVILVPIRNADRSMMQLVYGQLFHKAVELRVRSVAVPALGTGGFGLSFRQASIDMRDAISCIPDFGSLQEIELIDLSGKAMHEFKISLQELADPQTHGRRKAASATPGEQGSSGSQKRKREHENATAPDYYIAVSAAEIAKMRKDKADGDDEEQLACSICLGDMDSEEADGSSSVVRLVDCLHMFHEDCIGLAFKSKAQCPLCMRWYSAAVGNQPIGSTMTVRVVPGMVPGHPDATSYHEITYHVPSGKQTEQHPRPGRPYMGTTRTAYLPNNREGSLVLKLLQLAFSQRLIFTVGDSVTSGAQNVAIWNGIHHKTNLQGGAQYYGYPDENYLERVQEELGSLGIRKEMLDE